MNGLIKKFPSLKEKLESLGPVTFNSKVNQEEQTAEFLKQIGIEVK